MTALKSRLKAIQIQDFKAYWKGCWSRTEGRPGIGDRVNFQEGNERGVTDSRSSRQAVILSTGRRRSHKKQTEYTIVGRSANTTKVSWQSGDEWGEELGWYTAESWLVECGSGVEVESQGRSGKSGFTNPNNSDHNKRSHKAGKSAQGLPIQPWTRSHKRDGVCNIWPIAAVNWEQSGKFYKLKTN